MLGLRCRSKCAALLIGAVIASVTIIFLQRACTRSPLGMPRVKVVEPIERYDPDTRYEIPLPPQWKPTGRTIDNVPVVEPADERTRRKIERVFGEEEAKEIDFLLVGDIGRVRHGADVYVSRPKAPETIPVPDNSPEYGDLPRGVAKPEPLDFELVARPAPWFDVRSLHRVETWRQWEPDALDVPMWEVNYRPYELWIKGRIYAFLEFCYHQRAGESGLCGRGGAGICPGVDC